MSNDPLAVPDFLTEPPNRPDHLSAARSDLMEIAAAIDHIKAALDVGAMPAKRDIDAIEEMRDIAFVLHERAVESTLCDALDAAIRDVSDDYARSSSTAERMSKAAEMLGSLANRVGKMILADTAGCTNSAAIEAAAVRPIAATREIETGDRGDAARLPPHDAAEASERQIANRGPADSLAAVRALSEDELIALFS